MNVLLVYPTYPDTFWSLRHIMRFVSRKASFPPLGLLTVASMLPKEWNKKLVDENVSKLKQKDVEWADVVFISSMIIQKKEAQRIINWCKQFGKKIIAGGPAFTTSYKEFYNVDHFILDEGEVTLPMFLEDFEKGAAKEVYTSKERPDITKTPIPMWNLISKKDYVSLAVQYSRGCPFNCEFCDIVIMNGRVPRTKTPNQMIREFEALYKFGYRGSVFIVDDNFIGNKVDVKKMLLVLIDWQKKYKYPFKFITEASTNLACDKELMHLMSLANFHKVFLGIETPNVDSLKECGKFQNTMINLGDAVKIIQENGMQVMGGFIVGFDSDNENTFNNQIDFIQEIGVVTAMVGILNALPKTRLWHRLKAENRLVKHASGENTDGSLNFIPKIGKEKLIEGYKKILATIYNPKNYYKRIFKFIKNYKPTVRSKLKKEDFTAFFKSIWFIGILSKSRRDYWRLIVKTILINKKALAVAIELAIIGLHFEIITKKILKESS